MHAVATSLSAWLLQMQSTVTLVRSQVDWAIAVNKQVRCSHNKSVCRRRLITLTARTAQFGNAVVASCNDIDPAAAALRGKTRRDRPRMANVFLMDRMFGHAVTAPFAFGSQPSSSCGRSGGLGP